MGTIVFLVNIQVQLKSYTQETHTINSNMASPVIEYGLGDFLNAFSSDALDLPFPEPLVAQLNNKIGVSNENELVFNLDGASGVFAEDAGEMNWLVGDESANFSYEREVSDDMLEGKFSTYFEGPIDQFWKDNFLTPYWDSAKEATETFWNIDIVNMKAEFGYKATQDVVSAYGNEANFKYDHYVEFEVTDLDVPVVLKLKNKFAFVKFENYMAYVKSENFEGKMVSFAELPYLSFYYTENAAKQPFKTVRRSYDAVGEDLLLTVPVFAVVKEVTDAVMEIVDKWSEWGQYAIENPVKSAYWMDSMVHSVQPTTFDFSDLVASTRFGCGQYPNARLQEKAKYLANELYQELSAADFSWLEGIRAYVVEVQAAEGEVAVEFALPA